MYSNRPYNTTSIKDLPELEDIETHKPYSNAVRDVYKGSNYDNHQQEIYNNVSDNILPENSDKYLKYINKTNVIPMEAGMTVKKYNNYPEYSLLQDSNPMVLENQDFPKYNSRYTGPTCRDVYDHIGDCEICKRFYKTDNTLYIIIIVVLLLILLILLKRILEV